MTRRALVFGSAAVAYERYRLGYPVEVVTTILDYARAPVRTALEIGAGTGKATRLFAAHGIAVTATDPDAAMLEQLRAHVPAATLVQASLEDLVVTRRHDLVYAGASLHWTAPEGRWSRIADVLETGGVVASFAAPISLSDAQLAEAVRVARSPWLESDDVPSPDGTHPDDEMQWPGTELEHSERFTDVAQVTVGRHLTMSAADYVGLLSTISAYLELPEADRTRALGAIRRALPPEVDVTADVVLHLARSV